jgi:hypothetical protein
MTLQKISIEDSTKFKAVFTVKRSNMKEGSYSGTGFRGTGIIDARLI